MGCFQPLCAIPGKTSAQVKLLHLSKDFQKWEQNCLNSTNFRLCNAPNSRFLFNSLGMPGLCFFNPHSKAQTQAGLPALLPLGQGWGKTIPNPGGSSVPAHLNSSCTHPHFTPHLHFCSKHPPRAKQNQSRARDAHRCPHPSPGDTLSP